MKLPFDIGLRLLLRLLLPGFVLAAGCFPLAVKLRAILYPALSDELLFIGSGLFFGILIMLLDMPIYMMLEGRRFWPHTMRRLGVFLEKKRLARLVRRAENETDSAVQVEYDLLAAQFPIDRATGRPMARYPTRLGNLLASFETYPTVKYGIDGVFFWPRLWVTIDKDLREELDGAQAVVDGAIYTCACLVAVSLLFIGYAFWPWPYISSGWLWGALASLIGARALYCMALPRYAQYGELFAAVFDQHRAKLDQVELVTELDAFVLGHGLNRTPRERVRTAWRFLRWHRYRRPGQANEVIEHWLE